ncbi:MULTISPECIES: cupin domain-containing protein [Geodermatophilus]|uniref:cupin domain-containing protein n=1 Tax=Geodermatophilus sp. LHW52908 TaxID=2303986 RepID=UPI000E3CD091|nr:cupin domain-containing protein [Geodermatophilus sp. LHW52908]RFU22846.1 cupin domain-containing protein [Geodermatophilus sp. LHW52908]
MTTIQHPTSVIRCTHTVHRGDTPPNRRRGGDIRTLLSPASVGATAGFMGTLTLEPGEIVTEHWHPYSEEFLYCVSGDVKLTLDGECRRLVGESAVHVPIGVRHRIVNDTDTTAFFVFCLGPLAPRPELGHVDTEPSPGSLGAVR